MRASGATAAAALGFTLLVLLYLVGRPIATDDVWWHLAFGEMFLAEGLWPVADPMLHTAGEGAPIQHEWLFQVALHGLERATGFHGLRVLHVLAVAGIVLFAFSTFRRAGRDLAPAALASIVFIVVSWYRLFQLRPELVSIAAILALYRILMTGDTVPSARRVGAALLVLVVWVNAHSMFAIGIALLGAALAGALLGRLVAGAAAPGLAAQFAATSRGLAVALAAGLVLTLLNPRGIDQHLHFFAEASAGGIWAIEDDFLRFAPFSVPASGRALTFLAWLAMDVLLAAFALAGGAALFRLARRRGEGALADLDPIHLALGVAAVVPILVAVRFHWMAIFPLLYLLRTWRRHAAPRERGAAAVAAALAAASVALAVAFPQAIRLGSYADEVAVEGDGYLRSPWLDRRYCGPGMRFLRDAKLEGNLFNPFNLGGFLGYWLAPELRTFVDGRVDHYPIEVLRDYRRIMRAGRSGPARDLRRLLSERDVDIFFGVSFPSQRYAKRHAITHLRRLPEWILVYQSLDHSIYLHRDPRNRPNLARVVDYYRRLGVSFDSERGLDVGAVIRDAPEWAAAQNLIPANLERLEAARAGDDPAARRRALDRLGDLYWQIGNYPAQIAIDRELVALDPTAKEPRRRLAEALLQQGETRAALRVARSLYAEDPDYRDIAYLYAVAEQIELNERWRRSQRGSGATSPAR